MMFGASHGQERATMNVVIFGASGGTGQALVQQALDRGHTVTAFVRKASRLRIQHGRLRLALGNVLNYRAVEAAIAGQDAVLSALGHKRWIFKTSILSDGTRNILAAMAKGGVRRFVCETSLGVGDSRGRLGILYTFLLIPVLLYFYFQDKELQEKCIKQSNLDWVIVRPAALTNGKQTGAVHEGKDVGSFLFTHTVSRADVASFMLSELKDDRYLRDTPGVESGVSRLTTGYMR
jgi:putative NADH-flavin reductase